MRTFTKYFKDKHHNLIPKRAHMEVYKLMFSGVTGDWGVPVNQIAWLMELTHISYRNCQVLKNGFVMK